VTDQVGVQVSGATTGDLDDDEGGGLALNASSRALLMQKLDRSGITTRIHPPLQQHCFHICLACQVRLVGWALLV